MKLNDKVIIILLIISIIISTAFIVVKISSEQQNRKVEISVPLTEAEKLSKSSGKPLDEILSRFKSSGLTSLAIEEITLGDLEVLGRVLILNGWQMMDHQRFLGIESQVMRDLVSRRDFNPVSFYIFTKDEDVFYKLEEFMMARGYEIKSFKDSDDLYILQDVKGIGGFSSIGLGFELHSFEQAKAHGLHSIVLAKELASKMPKEIEYFVGQLQDKDISVFIPQGNDMPADSDAREILEKFLGDNHIILGFDEFLDTNSITDTVSKLEYSATRVYNRPPHKWMEEYLLAVRDRNDKVLYLHLFLSGHEDILSYNAAHLSEIRASIAKPSLFTNFEVSKVEMFHTFEFGKGLSFFAALGVIWAIGRILTLYGLSHKVKSCLCFFTFVGFAILAIWDFMLFRNIAGLMIAVAFPVCGIYREMKREGSLEPKEFLGVLKEAVMSFLRATVTAFLGALILWGVFGDMSTFLGLEKFRGIKALYIISFVLMLFFYMREKNGRVSLRKPIISMGSIFALTVVGGLLYVLINRTGNYSVIPIPKWELTFRIWLERVLPVRPRTKEFLIGFPALMIAGGLKQIGMSNWSYGFYVMALLAEVSMVNTFSHFHIYTLISMIRSIESILLGMILGALMLGGFYLYGKRRKIDV